MDGNEVQPRPPHFTGAEAQAFELCSGSGQKRACEDEAAEMTAAAPEQSAAPAPEQSAASTPEQSEASAPEQSEESASTEQSAALESELSPFMLRLAGKLPGVARPAENAKQDTKAQKNDGKKGKKRAKNDDADSADSRRNTTQANVNQFFKGKTEQQQNDENGEERDLEDQLAADLAGIGDEQAASSGGAAGSAGASDPPPATAEQAAEESPGAASSAAAPG
jgi:hypothetical protein